MYLFKQMNFKWHSSARNLGRQQKWSGEKQQNHVRIWLKDMTNRFWELLYFCTNCVLSFLESHWEGCSPLNWEISHKSCRQKHISAATAGENTAFNQQDLIHPNLKEELKIVNYWLICFCNFTDYTDNVKYKYLCVGSGGKLVGRHWGRTCCG